MIRLSQICLLVFLATLGFYLYQVHAQRDYTLSFLVMGAAACVYLLLRTEQRRHRRFTRYRPHPVQIHDKRGKRVEPGFGQVRKFQERRAIPMISHSQNDRTD